MTERPYTPAEERRPLRKPPPPEDTKYPPLAPIYGGHAGDDVDELERDAERVLEQWPAEHQGDVAGAIDHVIARRTRTR